MAYHGWVKEHRKIMDSLVWTNPFEFKLWNMILMLASHGDSEFIFNGNRIAVSSGQLVTGRDALAFMYNKGAKPVHQLSSRNLWRMIKKFEKDGMLSISSTARYSVITINNYSQYQNSVQPVSSSSPALVQPTATFKNLENDKKYSSSSARKDVLRFWEDNGFGVLASKTITDLDYWVKDFQEVGASESDANALLIKAMATAVDNNARTYNYVNGILKNWESHKFKSPEEVDAHEQSRNAGRDSKNSSKAGRRSGRGASQGKSYGGIEF